MLNSCLVSDAEFKFAASNYNGASIQCFPHPLYHFKMALPASKAMALPKMLLQAKKNRRERESRRKLKNFLLLELARRRKQLLCSWFQLIMFLMNHQKMAIRTPRSCRRLPRVQGWWGNIWGCSDDTRFKTNFRITKGTFLFILAEIREDLQRETTAEVPVTPEIRLAVCLYRLARGDYLHTIAELTGLGTSTVCDIVREVSGVLVNRLWHNFVVKNFPNNSEKLKEVMAAFEEKWQYPSCIGAVDGCHLPIKCPRGGQESAKEYHNFKNFFSIVLMALVDSKQRFMWASSGFPGNSHDAIILQSTKLYSRIKEGNIIPQLVGKHGNVDMYPMIIGDSAFPFHTWLMKPYTNAVLTPQQRYFNYRLSRARMVVEGAFGQLKGRWRVLMRKNECEENTLKTMSLACVVLHNICIDLDDKTNRNWDVGYDQATNKRRPSGEARNLLHMTKCRRIPDTCKNAADARDSLKNKFWQEKQECDADQC